MQSSSTRLAWLKSGLLWRTFLLLGVLITLSMAAWVASFRMIERAPKAEQIAAQVVSMVTITRAALTHSAPELRRELLFELANNEGIRVYPLEKTDVIDAPPEITLMPEFRELVNAKLGASTRFASRVNGGAGFWVSFTIDDDDEYWLMLDRGRIDRGTGLQWLEWAVFVLLLALLGAVLLSRLINLPLARLTAATREIARGHQPEPLPESGPTEIIEANRSFNQMVKDLNQVESDRALILAGISHDLRTPLARMQLEVEMADLPADARTGMQGDLVQMDAIIGQFLDYAKPSDSIRLERLDLAALMEESAREAARHPDVLVVTEIEGPQFVLGNATDLKRVITNLVENARRYGKSDDGIAEITLACAQKTVDGTRRVVMSVADRGAGVPPGEMEQLLKPFTRLDTARSQANGAGLGLAIVDRVVQRHGAQLRLLTREGGGFQIDVLFQPQRKN